MVAMLHQAPETLFAADQRVQGGKLCHGCNHNVPRRWPSGSVRLKKPIPLSIAIGE
jgi:hypothetical protein